MKKIIINCILIFIMIFTSSCELNDVIEDNHIENSAEGEQKEDNTNNKYGNYANNGYLDYNNDYIFYKNKDDNKDSIYKMDKMGNKTLVISDLINCSNIMIQEDDMLFLQKDHENSKYQISSVKNNGADLQKIIDSNYDITRFVLFENSIYYVMDSGEKDEVDLPKYYLYKYGIADGSNTILDENTSEVSDLIVHENKIIYRYGTYLKVYNITTNEKISMLTTSNGENLRMLQYHDNSIYYTNGEDIKKVDIDNFQNNFVEADKIISKPKEIFNINNLNISDEYMFFTGQYEKKEYGDTSLLNIFRVNKDGKELKKIVSADFNMTELDNRINNYIYIVDEKLILFDYYSNVVKIFDFDGKEQE